MAVIMCFTAVLLLTSCGQRQPPGKATPTASPESVEREGLSLVERGEIFYQANCLTCHGDREGRGATSGAPSHNEAGHTWHHPDAQLKEWILNGRLFGGMPAFKGKLTEQDADAVLTYIKTWWTEVQRESQADISRRYQEALEKQKKGQ
jgi:mono/diheme cytochrome c family protein